MQAIPNSRRVRDAADPNWWRSMDPAGAAAPAPIEVPMAPLLDAGWCAVRHVSLGSTPHQVKFRRDSHTLMIFDRGCFLEGERWIDGKRLSSSGPLDTGIDIVPAHADFHAWAGPGSSVGCTVISIMDDDLAGTLELPSGPSAGLFPAVGVANDLLAPLAARLRQVCRVDRLAAGDQLYLESLCTVLLRELLLLEDHSAAMARPTGGLSAKAQRMVREFLHENLDQKIDLQTLADQAGVSRFHFTRAFKVSFGVPPYKYLLNLRLRRAAELLRSSRQSITDIALSVGFSCSSELARAFRQVMECTPREFRQQNH